MAKIFTRYALIITLLAPALLIAQNVPGINSSQTTFDQQTANISQWEASANIRTADVYYLNTTDIDKNKKVTENSDISNKVPASKPLVIKVDTKQAHYKNTTKNTVEKDISYQITDISQVKNNKILMAFFESENK